MTRSCLTKFALRTTALGALFVGAATFAMAQQPKPTAGPPVTTKGTAKAAPKADKGQATAESKRADARERKTELNAVKTDNAEHRSAVKAARDEPKALLKGIKLTKEQRKAVKATEKQYAGELKALEAQAKAADKAGRADPSVMAKIEDLRQRERADLRKALPPQAQAQFDSNAAAYGTRKS